ncbi:MAG: SDR family oxidoreductase [Verrucomicrobia bacterium]|nr:SDR family oxidoreductase [Verrucomicrobiota bacterium]
MNDDKAKKKIVVITGVTRGLGRAMAEKFIALGHTVLGCGRSRQLIDELRQKYPKRHDFDVVDVTSDEEVQAWMARLHKKCGAPDLILNNAGIINPTGPLWKIAAKDFSDVIDVNIKGSANVIRNFLPNMIKKHHGLIVNFSSGWGRSADKDVAPYVATKWAIEGLTQALSMEIPAGLGVVALNPGIINTDMLQSCFGESAAHYPSATRWAERAVPFILKLDENDNGQALSVPDM